jgi:ketosteroid isomerase-like protein
MPVTLEEASEGFYHALNATLGGDAGPMLELWSHSEDVTYMSPFGELLVGWEPVRDSWLAQAEQHLAGRVDPEELRHFASPTLGFVVGFERGSVEIDGSSTPVNIRATSMYRLEDGQWKMIGHHTDPLG